MDGINEGEDGPQYVWLVVTSIHSLSACMNRNEWSENYLNAWTVLMPTYSDKKVSGYKFYWIDTSPYLLVPQIHSIKRVKLLRMRATTGSLKEEGQAIAECCWPMLA
jgi:hypothetical protein